MSPPLADTGHTSTSRTSRRSSLDCSAAASCKHRQHFPMRRLRLDRQGQAMHRQSPLPGALPDCPSSPKGATRSTPETSPANSSSVALSIVACQRPLPPQALAIVKRARAICKPTGRTMSRGVRPGPSGVASRLSRSAVGIGGGRPIAPVRQPLRERSGPRATDGYCGGLGARASLIRQDDRSKSMNSSAFSWSVIVVVVQPLG